jgi:hypothetical protein
VHGLIGSAALALAATVTPGAAPGTETVQPAVPAPVRAAAPRRQRRQDRIAMSTSAPSSDDAAIQSQIELHVLMPALTGDGGG